MQAALIIVLGPAAAVEGPAIDRDRRFCCELDFDYYGDMLEQAPVGQVFANPAWGEVSIDKELIELEGHDCPALRVTWAGQARFVADSQDAAVRDKLNAMASFLAEALGAAWYRWRVAV